MHKLFVKDAEWSLRGFGWRVLSSSPSSGLVASGMTCLKDARAPES